MVTIKDWDLFKKGSWDWSVLDGCFGGSTIAPTDVDGMIERNDFFLFLETKLPGVQLKLGQRMALERLSRKPGVSVLVIYGAPGNPEQIDIWHFGRMERIVNASLNILRNIVSDWYRYANGHKREVDWAWTNRS